MRDRFLATGTAAFIRSRLTDRLLTDGHAMLGVDSLEGYYPRAIKEANHEGARANRVFTLRETNVLDLAAEAASGGPEARCAEGFALADLLRGCACIYHMAAQAGVRASMGGSFEPYSRDNVQATQLLLEACVAAGVPKVIHASSSSV